VTTTTPSLATVALPSVPTPGAPRVASELALPTISIVIPAHNEEGGIGDVLNRLRESPPPGVIEVIVIDDGSRDRTGQIVAEWAASHPGMPAVAVIRHPRNKGYGASLKTGIKAATGDYVLTMDADGQHRLEDVTSLCNAIRGVDPPDCVIGNRTALLHSPLWRMPGKWALTRMARVLTQRKIPDLNSGLRLVRRDVLRRYVHLCPAGYSFSTTITMTLLSRGYSVEFVPIRVEKRIGKSMVTMSTGFQTLLLVLRLATLFNPLRIFVPISFFFILGGVAWTVPYLIARQGVTVASMLLIVTGVLLFGMGLICDQVASLRLERNE
jgi:glycosyltransferase involved in cell wall biosynthesis